VSVSASGLRSGNLPLNGTAPVSPWGALDPDAFTRTVSAGLSNVTFAAKLWQLALPMSAPGDTGSGSSGWSPPVVGNVAASDVVVPVLPTQPAPCLIPVAAICAFTATIPALYVYLILAAIGLVVLLVITLVAYCCCCRRGRKAPASGASGTAVARSCAACREAFKPQQHFHACAPCGYDLCTRCYADIPPAARQRMHAHALAFYVVDASGHALPAAVQATAPIAAVVALPGEGTFTGVNPRFGPAGVAV